MIEEWKNIVGFNDYMISNYGRVKSLKRGSNILLPDNRAGYYCVTLYDNNNRKKKKYIHRLVAEHFVKNKNNENDVVNHIDCDKHNNQYTNLEWVTASQNTLHAYENGCIKRNKNPNYAYGKEIIQIDTTTNKVLNTYYSTSSAAKAVNGNRTNISRTCKGMYKTYKGYIWKFK